MRTQGARAVLKRSRSGVQSHLATWEAAEVFKESSDFITLWVADFDGRVEKPEEGRSSGALRWSAEAAGLWPWAPTMGTRGGGSFWLFPGKLWEMSGLWGPADPGSDLDSATYWLVNCQCLVALVG